MNPLIQEKLKSFDTFIDSLPSRVGETPKEVLKEWLEAALQDIEKRTVQDISQIIEEKGHQQNDDTIWCNMDEVISRLKQEHGL